MPNRLIWAILVGFLFGIAEAPAQIAQTLPTDWNRWNFFGEKIDDVAVRKTADILVASGPRDVRHIFVNINDT